MNTDIVIPFRSTRQFPTEEYLEKCVDSLVQKTHNYRLIFVDDNSDQIGRDCIQRIADRFPESTLIRTNKQKWFTRAVNIGLCQVRTPWAVEINSDVTFGDGWLDELYAVRDEITNAGGRAGLIGSVYAANEQRRYACTRPPDFVTGHTVLFNMQAMNDVANKRGTPGIYLNELNSKYIHIFSDNEICYEMNSIGYQTVMAFKSGVGHALAGRSWGHLLGSIPNNLHQVDFQYTP